MADTLNIERNSQNEVWPTGNESACCRGQQRVSNMADKHEIEDNAPRAHLRQEVEFFQGYYLRESINLMQISK